jgi:hypothetical protein
LFVSSVTELRDAAKREQRHQLLQEQGARTGNDWRWEFDQLEAMHFSECSLYAKLAIAKLLPSDTVINVE